MMLRSAINITHIPEEQVAYRQCTRPSLPPVKASLREAGGTLLRIRISSIFISLARPDVPFPRNVWPRETIIIYNYFGRWTPPYRNVLRDSKYAHKCEIS